MKEYTIALAGNPNVGKSTVFNSLTGMRQHTGNWPGKTVENAIGETYFNEKKYIIYDLPGTYSLISHSKEEEVARDFICFEQNDAIIVVCDAVCLERNLNLVLQVLEITNKVVVCVNLMDEAQKKHIEVDLEHLSRLLNVPVVGTSARSNKGLKELMKAVESVINSESKKTIDIIYRKEIEEAITIVEEKLDFLETVNKRWFALKLIDDDNSLLKTINENYQINDTLDNAIIKAREFLRDNRVNVNDIKELVVSRIVSISEFLASQVVTFHNTNYNKKDRKIDRFLTGKWTGIPLMLLLLMAIFWLTIEGANLPSSLLFDFFNSLGEHFSNFLNFIHAPTWLHDLLYLGVYRVVTWITAVMLPPMAIFFPLFTLLEDLGVLPRIAFNLDRCFKKCCTCGKQALTMCMGFGCNAAGVTGTRIIDSPRERLIAILTNAFVPCNGRFPALISVITMFFVGFSASGIKSLQSVSILTLMILLGIITTFLVSRLLSKTILKGIPSSFTLELPPYRKPQIGKVIIRSIFDRTLFVLGRAIVVAIPAGVIIWIMANIHVGDFSLLTHCSNFLDPIGKIMGLDGVILMAFILGFPANEIVIPIIIMAYLQTGAISDFSSLVELKALLVNHGWTWITAICMMIFILFHFPCSTTCLTIKKETGSWKWTTFAFLLPTIIGFILCVIVNLMAQLI